MKKQQEEIFRGWLERYRGLVIKVSRAYAAGEAEQEDLAQEILLQMWRSCAGYRGQCGETTWVYRVAINTAMVFGRNEISRKKLLTSLRDHATQESVRENGLGEDEEVLRKLYEAIQRLEKDQRSVILMHLDGLSYGEMAEVLGISANNAGVKLARAKQRLCEMLDGVRNEF